MTARLVTLLTFIVGALLLPVAGPGATAHASTGSSVSGVIAAHTTWSLADSPVSITGPVTIPAGVTLTVEPGVTIQDSTTTGSNVALFSVAGSFVARGTADALVSLSSSKYHPLFAGPQGSAVDSATGVIDLAHVSLVYRLFLPSSAADGSAMAQVSITDSQVTAPNSSMSLHRTREITLARNAFALGVSTPVYTSIQLGPGRTSTTIVDNRLRGVQVRCEGEPLTLRGNTFESMIRWPSGQGSGIRVDSPTCSVDARDNYWEDSGDLGQRIYDGRDSMGLPVVDVSTRLEAPTAETPHLPPGRMGYVQQRAYVTGVTAWWDPANPGGLPLTYTVGAYPVGSGTPEQEQESSGSSVVFRGLDPEKEYLLHIVARNALGTSQTSGSEAIRPAEEATVPSKPNVSLTLQPRAVELSFDSESDGGTAIDYYQWFIDGPDLEGMTGSGGSQTYARFDGLTPGEQYTITVYAVNAMGQSESAVVSFTAATTPDKMAAPRVVVRGQKAVVRWEATDPNGSPITRYAVEINRGKNQSVDGNARKAVFQKLRPGRYKFRVRAYNELGSSPTGARRGIRIR